MSQFSEMMGSFIRTGNYPMEANYIFPTEAALKEFYNDPINATTLHKGLLKLVENGGDGKQALYWVVKKQTNDDLEFVKLIENIDIDTIDGQLEDLYNRLEEEIKNRKDGETAIWGTNDPTNVPEELNSLLDLATAVTNLIKEVQDIHKELIDSDESIRKSLKTEIKATVGTQENDIVSYLKTLPYKSLTEAANALNKFLNTTDVDSNQINTLPELQFFLEGYNDTQKLRHVLLDLQAEILGNPFPTREFRTLRAIEDFVRILKADSEATDNNIQSELDNTQIGVGLSGDGSYNADKETYYLKDATSIMNALKVLDSLMYEAIKGITIQASNEDVVNLNVRKELEGYVIGATLNLSNVLGNDLIKKDDGLYFNVKSTYNNGTLSLYVNDKLVAQHILGFSSIVESAFYDSSNESIVIVFKLLSGEKQTITIPVGTLIRELEVDNSQPNKVVELVRETVVDGADKLSADVRIHVDKHNILKKVGNALSVDGTTDSITHNDKTLNSVIEEIRTTEAESTSNLTQKITAEVDRAKAEEGSIKTSLGEFKDNTNKAVSDLKLKDSEIQAAVLAETNRATEVENNIKASVQDLKASDSTIKESIEELKVSTQNNAREITTAKNLIGLEAERAQNAEETLTQRASAIEAELSDVSKQQVDTGKEVVSLTNKLDSEIARSTTKDSELNIAISKEIDRATEQERVLSTALDTKVGTVTIRKSEANDLQYILYVDSKASGEINIPKDQFLKSVTLENNSILQFKFETTSGVVTTDINIEDVFAESLSNLETKVNQKADIVSPIFTGIPQIQDSPDENDSSQRIPTTNWVNTRVSKSEETFNQHIKDKQNPHNVTAEQIGAYTKLEIDSKFNKIDEITNKCIKATDEASKINATLDIDTNTLTVTDRNGISTSLEVWGTTDEHISVYLSSEDGLATVSNLDVSLVYVGTDQVYHATTDDNGICQFIVPNGIKYRIILPEIQDYLTPAEEEHMASIASRSIEHRYRRIGEEVEQVYIQVNQMENGVYSPIENHQIKLKIGTGTTSTYYTPENGTLVLNIPSGQEYVIDIATKENYYIRGQKYHYELQATQIRRHIYVNFRAYESGIWIVTDQNEEVTYEDWIQQDRDPQSAQLIKIATGELSAAGGVYYLKIDDLRFRNAPSHQWASQNVLFTSIPENGNSLTADYYYDGYTSTKNIQQEGDTRTIGTNAADYALAQTLQIGELTLNGFMGSCGQWITVWRNKEHIDDILEVVRPDLNDGKTYYLFSNWSVAKWTSSQNGASNAWYLSSVFNVSYNKYNSYAVLVFYAPS